MKKHQFTENKQPHETVDLNNVCRGCYGYGDGICAYHHGKFNRLHKRQIALLRHFDRRNREEW